MDIKLEKPHPSSAAAVWLLKFHVHLPFAELLG